MTSLVLNAETANLPLGQILQQLGSGGVEIKDPSGNLIALLLGPVSKQTLTYIEANLDINSHLHEVRAALGRRDGITTSELLAKAILAAEQASQQ